jgi:hypothetical protein
MICVGRSGRSSLLYHLLLCPSVHPYLWLTPCVRVLCCWGHQLLMSRPGPGTCRWSCTNTCNIVLTSTSGRQGDKRTNAVYKWVGLAYDMGLHGDSCRHLSA